MRVVFRTDASRDIGAGHVVRCASLAAALRESDDEVVFCCRELAGNMIAWLKASGLDVHTLQSDDPAEFRRVANGADWLVVDHYGLDADWEKQAKGGERLLAVDDLGRPHACDMLLDQNYDNPLHGKYAVPAGCIKLFGPGFALIRPEFSRHRAASLARPRHDLSRLLVFMGGMDEENETKKALHGIALSRHREAQVEAVIGSGNPHRALVEQACAALPAAQLHVQTERMAELMSAADLMLCAGGSVTWERCTLGVPALVTILADNQAAVAQSLAKIGAHRTLGRYTELAPSDYAAALDAIRPDQLGAMSSASAAICDGKGAARVIGRLKAQGMASHG